jgi:hypothetical protein
MLRQGCLNAIISHCVHRVVPCPHSALSSRVFLFPPLSKKIRCHPLSLAVVGKTKFSYQIYTTQYSITVNLNYARWLRHFQVLGIIVQGQNRPITLTVFYCLFMYLDTITGKLSALHVPPLYFICLPLYSHVFICYYTQLLKEANKPATAWLLMTMYDYNM